MLKEAYEINKNIPLGVLTETYLDEAVEFAKTIEAVSIHSDYTLLTPENVLEIQREYKVIAFTVNNIKPIERMIEYGVDGIISDYPDRL